ncbi:MAG TPA: DUF1697 domain-containing protein, partial [Tenuifilaceae bacterium]|nr:DUF1697 domain-containing protein [Tenuifilaceae bacterium]
MRYTALLRGINVGGNNIIKMAELRACFVTMSFTDVKTYIQSGNVLFSSDNDDKSELVKRIESELSRRFNYQSKIVLVSQNQIETVIKTAPEGFGTKPEEFRYDVVFLKEPLSSNEAFQSLKLREGVDNAYVGKDVLYLSRLISRAGQSYLSKIISLPVYQFMTIRNWNTTTKLFELIGE